MPASILVAALAGALLASAIRAQQQIPAPAFVTAPGPSIPASTLILLDPAHGGADNGAVLGDQVDEKDVTLALAAHLRTALLSAGFTVASTRDSDPADLLTTDQRAELANRSHPLACLVLHATATGTGVHVYNSSLGPPLPEDAGPGTPGGFVPVPWDTAQAGFVMQSVTLAGSISTALGKNHISALTAQSALRPLDNLMCPAVAIEIAPLSNGNSSSTPVSDSAYQQRVAATLSDALRAWRDQNHPTSSVPNLDSQIAAQSRAITAAEAAERARSRILDAPSVTKRGTQ